MPGQVRLADAGLGNAPAGRKVGAGDVGHHLVQRHLSRFFYGVSPDFSVMASRPLMISVRLCGGMLVAMPTAMPEAPLTSRLGNEAGRTLGSSVVSS